MGQAESSLKTRLNEDVKPALRARDKRRAGTLRLILAAIKQREVDERIQLDDSQILAVLDKMLKQRRDSLSQYQTAGRADLADQESYEIALIQSYMPAALSGAEIEALITEALQDAGAASIKDLGKVMALLKPKLQGRADLSQVSAKLKAKLEVKS